MTVTITKLTSLPAKAKRVSKSKSPHRLALEAMKVGEIIAVSGLKRQSISSAVNNINKGLKTKMRFETYKDEEDRIIVKRVFATK